MPGRANRLPLPSRRIAHCRAVRGEVAAPRRGREVGWYHEPDTARPLSGGGGFFVPESTSGSRTRSGVAALSRQEAIVRRTRGTILSTGPDPGRRRAKRRASRRGP